jgi:hypothetical protein
VTESATPDAALLRWVQSIPAVRCVAPAFRPWIKAKDATVVPIRPVSPSRFAHVTFSGGAVTGLTVVAGSAAGDTYALGRVPRAGAIVLEADSVAQEDSFTALVMEAGAPPRAVAALPAVPRLSGNLGLGSTRAAVEAALGAGKAKTLCGFDVVRYEPRPQAISEEEMWFFYRAGVVVAIARYEAV